MSDQSTPIALAAGQLVTGSGVLKGVSFRETAGAVAIVQLFDNTAGSGVLLGTYGFVAKQSIDIDFNNTRHLSKGIFAVITGTVEGSIFT
jgi:hypothetical protein